MFIVMQLLSRLRYLPRIPDLADLRDLANLASDVENIEEVCEEDRCREEVLRAPKDLRGGALSA